MRQRVGTWRVLRALGSRVLDGVPLAGLLGLFVLVSGGMLLLPRVVLWTWLGLLGLFAVALWRWRKRDEDEDER